METEGSPSLLGTQFPQALSDSLDTFSIRDVLVQAFFFPPLKNSRLLCGKGWKAVNKNQEGFISGHSGCWRSYGLDLDEMDISWIPNLLCQDTFAWGKYFVHMVSSDFHVFKNSTLESFTVQHLAIGVSISVFWFTLNFIFYIDFTAFLLSSGLQDCWFRPQERYLWAWKLRNNFSLMTHWED